MIQVIIYGIISGAFYGLAAIGLSLVFGVMGHLNIAHGSFIMLGGYCAYWFFQLLKIDPLISIPLVDDYTFYLSGPFSIRDFFPIWTNSLRVRR